MIPASGDRENQREAQLDLRGLFQHVQAIVAAGFATARLGWGQELLTEVVGGERVAGQYRSHQQFSRACVPSAGPSSAREPEVREGPDHGPGPRTKDQ